MKSKIYMECASRSLAGRACSLTARSSTFERVARAIYACALLALAGTLWSDTALAQQAAEAPARTATSNSATTSDAAAPSGTAAAAPGSRPFGAPSVATGVAPTGIASLGQVTLALGLVLALIFVAAWLMRRLRGFGKSGTDALDIVADLAVGQKERAVLIRVGTQQVLIGVSPGRVTTLHVLAEPVSITPPRGTGTSGSGTLGSGHPGAGSAGAERPTFKSLLMKSLGK